MYGTNVGDTAVALALAATAARTTTGSGTAIDLQQYDGEAALVLDSAAGSGTSPTLDVTLEHSDDNSSFSAVSGVAFTQVTGAASMQKISINRNELKRYVREKHTIGGTTPSFTFSLNVLAWPKYAA